MALSDELTRLAELHERGVLSSEEFQRAKTRLLDAPAEPTLPTEMQSALNRLRRSRTDRWLGGVCGGLARMVGADAWVIRLCFALLFLFAGTGLLLYILLWILVPDEG